MPNPLADSFAAAKPEDLFVELCRAQENYERVSRSLGDAVVSPLAAWKRVKNAQQAVTDWYLASIGHKCPTALLSAVAGLGENKETT